MLEGPAAGAGYCAHGAVPRSRRQPDVHFAEFHRRRRLGLSGFDGLDQGKKNMRLIQYRQKNGSRKVGLVTEDGDHVRPIKGVATIFELANLAIDKRKPLAKLAEKRATDERVDYLALLKAGRVLVPLDHPEPARFLVTGTGLTHLGSAFSDHVTEAQNYLYTQHSKLRACSIGPELLLGELPQDVRGTTRILRKGKVIWQDEFLSGEEI